MNWQSRSRSGLGSFAAAAVAACLLAGPSHAQGDSAHSRYPAELSHLNKCDPLLAGYKWQLSFPANGLVGYVFEPAIPSGGRVFNLVHSPVPGFDERLLVALARAQFILLGEVHDNPDHHGLRAAILGIARCLSPPGSVAAGAAVFEHIRADQAGAIDGPPATPADAAVALLRRLDWSNSGWPDQAMFQPLFAAAYVGGLAILAGEPARGSVRQVAREGFPALPPAERQRLQLDRELPAASNEALLGELVASHCNMMPASAMNGLAQAQRYRDAHQADAMLAAGERHEKVFLLAGNGHVRMDRGVPWHLRNRKPDARVLTIMLVEVEDGKQDERSYVPRGPDGRPAADLIIFTPRVDRNDPCEKMRAMKR